VGILLGSATATLFSYILSEHDLNTWGWRVPFLLGITICFVGYYLRTRIPESPEYTEIQKSGTVAEYPIIQVFSEHWKTLTVVVLAIMLHDLSFYMLFTYMPTFMTKHLHLAEDVAFTINTVNLFLVCVFTVLGAWLSDRIGRKPVMTGAALIFIFGTIPLFSMITSTSDMMTVFWAQLVFAIAAGGYFGPTAAMMVEAFPTAIRFSAIAITTNISGPLFGGTAPVLVTYLIDKMGSNMVPAFYLTGAAVLSLIALKFVSLYQGEGALKKA
jgi:MFS transporter, MHS family, proline/betaine transporter